MTSMRHAHLAVVLFLLISLACATMPAGPLGSGSESQSTAAPTATEASPAAQSTPALPTSASPALPLPTPTISANAESSLMPIVNQSGSISMTVPATWTDVRSSAWKDEDGRVIGDVLTASPDIDRFLQREADGVSVMVSRRLGIGYIQLLDAEFQHYSSLNPTSIYRRYFDFANSRHRGKSISMFFCGPVQGCNLDVFALVPVSDPSAYVAEVLLYEDLPYLPSAVDERIMDFAVDPAKLP